MKKNKLFLIMIFIIGFIFFPSSVFADKIYININEAGEPVEERGTGWYFSPDSTSDWYGINLTDEHEYYFVDNEVNCPVFNIHGTIVEGIFNDNINNYHSTTGNKSTATIAGGTYNAAVYNYGLSTDNTYAKITGGTFNEYVHNSGIIAGGLFTGYVKSNTNITGGIFIGEIVSDVVHKVTVSNGLIVGANTKEAYIPEGSMVEIEATISDYYWVYNMELSETETTGKTTFKMPTSDVVVEARTYTSSLIQSIEKTNTVDNIDTYTITFADGTTYEFKISNGLPGEKGENAISPKININDETGEWEVSYDNGITWQSLGIIAEGQNGTNGVNGINGINGINGQPGEDGITPRIRISEETGEWEVSYDNGKSWESLGVKAIGEDGTDGVDGVDGTNGKIEYSAKEYIIIIVLGALAILGNIGWIVNLKKKGL